MRLRKGRYGNATLSRWPIRRERNIDLTVGFLRRRGCQHTRIAVQDAGRARRGGSRSSTCTWGSRPASASGRCRCSCRSKEFAALPFGVPTLVAGDTNDWRSLLRPLFVDMLGFRSATGGNEEGERATATFPSFFPQGALDRVYYRGPLRLVGARRCRLALSRVASDHLPVIVDFDSMTPGSTPGGSGGRDAPPHQLSSLWSFVRCLLSVVCCPFPSRCPFPLSVPAPFPTLSPAAPPPAAS